MDSAMAMASSSLFLSQKSTLTPPFFIFKHSSSKPSFHTKSFRISASSSSSSFSIPVNSAIRTTAAALIFSAAVFGKFHHLPARADPPPPLTSESEVEEKSQVERSEENSRLTRFLESGTESVEAMKTFIEERLEAGEDELGLKILKKLSSAQPENSEWKFLMARVLSEMGNSGEAREVFEEILAKNPLSFGALFENALLMDRCGEGEKVIERLEAALRIAEEEKKVDAVRDVRLIIAQVQFLQKNVEEALRSYEELEREDPNDFRPPFCKGVIYSLMDRNIEAKEQFAKFRQLAPKKFDVEGFLRSSLSRMKLFGTDEEK